MITISPAGVERAEMRLSSANLEEATKGLEVDGFIVLENVVDLGHIAMIRDQMLKDVDEILKRPDRPFNWTRGNLQQDPPPFPPYLFSDVVSNEYAIQVTQAVLGNGLYNAFYSGNTALHSDQRQPVHADAGQLWPNLKQPTPPFSLVVNLPMVDMGPENGSTEIWPGTHTDPSVAMSDGDIVVAAAKLEDRRKISPPIQPIVKAGSIVIRDIRLWHAGMPNRTKAPRPMIAMIHTVAWMAGGKPKFRRDAEPILRHPVLRHQVEYVDEVDHIASPMGFNT